MVDGNEYVFADIDEAIGYVLGIENDFLQNDSKRLSAPKQLSVPYPLYPTFVPDKFRKEVSVNSLDYTLPSFFNVAPEDSFIMNKLASGRYSLKPNLRKRHYLFRGENQFHSPCKPNLFRNIHKSQFIEESVKGQEMMLLMLSHPLVRLLDIGVELCGIKCQLEMNLYGLTQHYYNKTVLLDLTSNPQVAAFFATSMYDVANDEYSPISGEEYEDGILYYYALDIEQDFKFTDGKRSPLSTIGLQVFPRSASQYGFLFSMQKNEDFNDVARLHAVRFKHNLRSSKKYFDLFHGGKDLFPKDILCEHWKNYMNNRKVISNRAIKLNHIFNPNQNDNQIVGSLQSRGYTIDDYIPQFTKEELDSYYESIRNGFWETFCGKIFIPGDDGKMKEDLLNLPNNANYKWAFEDGHCLQANFNEGYLLKMYASCLQ